jgi:GDPmannose 4,6-dehydratase
MRFILKILITGAAGQDGKILADQLIANHHELVMLCRPNQSNSLQFEFPTAKIIGIDHTNFENIALILRDSNPDTIINLAAFSSVKDSWKQPEVLEKINVGLPRFLLEWVRVHKPDIRFLQASSSEIFGSVSEEPQNEMTLLRPLTPYGHSKASAHQLGVSYREKYNMNISNIIFYNHESLNRSNQYVTRHISSGVASIFLGKSKVLKIGNLQARRDWGWAPEYMQGLGRLIEREKYSDFVFATGQTHSVEDLIRIGFNSVGISDFSNYIQLTQEELRMADPVNLCGDSTKARIQLGWEPTLKAADFIPLMVANDVRFLSNPSAAKESIK